jgi:hypothetical protein
MGITTGQQPKSIKGKKNIEPTSYQCDNCAAKVQAYGEIPRCLGCGKYLCEICNNYFLCPQDFHKLEPKDQKKVKRLGSSLENARNAAKMFKIMPLILGIIGAVLLIIMLILDDEMFYFIFGFIGGSLLLFGGMMFGVFHNFEERERKRVSDQVRNVIIPYNMQQVIHGQEGQKQQNIGDNERKEDTEDKILICPNCGEEVKGPNVQYCENCGSKLI